LTGGLVALALLLPAAPADPPALPPGTELLYAGTVEEAVERPGARFRRAQKLDVRVLVLEAKDAWLDVAVLTLLRRRDDAVAGAVGAVTGGAGEKAAPPGVRLDLLRVHADGTAHHLHPPGLPPLALDAKTPGRALPPIGLDAFTPFEFGMFPPRPPRDDPDKEWRLASADPARPAEVWQAQGTGTVAGARCALLVMNQEHPNWASRSAGRPRGTGPTRCWWRPTAPPAPSTASSPPRRARDRPGRVGRGEVRAEGADAGHRPHARRVPAGHRDRVRRRGRAGPVPGRRVRHGPRFFESKGHKLDAYLEAADASSPYREAVLAVPPAGGRGGPGRGGGRAPAREGRPAARPPRPAEGGVARAREARTRLRPRRLPAVERARQAGAAGVLQARERDDGPGARDQ
jgi:hypothetical protein